MILPSQEQKQKSPLQQTGEPFTNTFNFDDIHGVAVAGMHGASVTIPKVAADIAMTAGFVGAEQMPKLLILTIGKKSLIFKFIIPDDKTVLGKAEIGMGIVPNEQEQIAP